MNNATKTTFKIAVAFLWLAFVGYSFVLSHSYYQEAFGFIGRVILMSVVFLIALGIPIGIGWGWEYFKKKTFKPSVLISPWKSFLAIMIVTASLIVATEISADLAIYHGGMIFQDAESWGVLPEGVAPSEDMEVKIVDNTLLIDSQSFIKLLPAELSSSFEHVNLLKAIWIVESNLLMGLGFILLLTFIAFAIGHRVLRLMKFGELKRLEEFLLSVAIGFGVLMADIFLLGLFSVATLPVVAGSIAVLTAVSYKDAYMFLRGLVFGKLEVSPNLKSLNFGVVLSGILVLGYNFLSIIRPMPIGWDDASQYLYIPEKFTYLHGLLDGFKGMYNWELVNAIGSYSSSALLPLFTNFLGGLLAVAAIFLLLSKFMKKETAIMLSAIFYILPMVIFQSSTDLKNDLACLFFIIMSVWAFLKWFNDSENATRWLGLAGILIGLAIGIKITAGLALIMMAVLMAKKLIGNKGAVGVALVCLAILLHLAGDGNLFKISNEIVFVAKYLFAGAGIVLIAWERKIKSIKSVLVFLILMAICLAPWRLVQGEVKEINFDEVTSDCSIQGMNDEFSSYVSGRGSETSVITPLSILKAPWQMTMNPGFNNPYVDISMIFLGLLPLFIWYFVERKNDKDFRLIFGLSALYFSMLVFFFFEVPWYGYFGFVMLLILVGRMLEVYEAKDLRGEKLLSMVVKIAIGATAILVVMMKIGSFGDEKHLAYLGGVLDSKGYISAVNPGVLDSVEIVTADTSEDNLYLYRIGGATPYFFANSDMKFATDESLDVYMCMKGADLGEKLKELGVSYIAFDYTILLEEGVNENLAARYNDFLEFGKRFFDVMIEKEDFILFKIR